MLANQSFSEAVRQRSGLSVKRSKNPLSNMIFRIFVEKREAFRVEADSLRHELNENLQLHLQSLRYINVYDLFGFTPELGEQCRYKVFGETVTDTVSDSCALEGK